MAAKRTTNKVDDTANRAKQLTDEERLEAWRKKRLQRGTFEKPGGKKRTKDL